MAHGLPSALLVVLLAPLLEVQGAVRVEEAGIQVALEHDLSLVTVPIDNPGVARQARLVVDVLTSSDVPRVRGEAQLEPQAGRNQARVRLPRNLGEPDDLLQSQLALRRLRYELTAEGGDAARRVRAVGPALVGRFALRVTANSAARAGGELLLQVHCLDPQRAAPVPGVALVAAVADSATPGVAGTCDAAGRADLRLTLPEQPWRGLQQVRVEGRHAGLRETAEVFVWLDRSTVALVTTDKPLYRPGQVLRARALVLDPGRRVLAGLPVRVRVADPKGSTVFQSALATSAAGVVHFDWPIPSRAELGSYAIGLEASGQDGGQLAQVEFKVGRYELPTFRLEARPVRAYFLPGEAGRVEIRAQSLTGEPLAGAAVEITHDDEPQPLAHGRTDATGRAELTLDLSEAALDLGPDWIYQDARFVAQVRDPIGGRSEARRFDVRVTREPIHVYFQSSSSSWHAVAGLPLRGHVSTYYADGRPCACRLELAGAIEGRATADRNGHARVAARTPLPSSASERRAELRVVARDGQGRSGHLVEPLWTSENPAVELELQRPLLRAGEPIGARVLAEPASRVRVQLWAREALLAERTLDATPQGTALEFPWQPAFRGRLTLGAQRLDDDDSVPQASVGLMYPQGEGLGLRLDALPGRARPGSSVTARLELRDSRGRPASGVAGLVGVDVALLERARSEEQFGGFWYDGGLPWDDASRGGLRRSDLERLDPGLPFSDEQQLAAEILLRDAEVWIASTRSAEPDVRRAYAQSLDALVDGLRRRPAADDPPGADTLEAVRAGRPAGGSEHGLIDPWGEPLAFETSPELAQMRLTATSAGPDERLGTGDDLQLVVTTWPWLGSDRERLCRALIACVDRMGVPRSVDDLQPDLQSLGLQPSALRDPWGAPLRLRLEFRERYVAVVAESRGPGPGLRWFEAGRAQVELFAQGAQDVARALDAWVAVHHGLPRTLEELRAAGVVPAGLRDPWGRACRAALHEEARYAERLGAEARAGALPARTAVTPVTERVDVIEILSDGPDGRAGTHDDVALVTFRRVRGEQGVTDVAGSVKPESREPVVSDSRGALVGVVVDEQGEPVPGVLVSAVRGVDEPAQATSDHNGAYTLGGLLPGTYTLRFELPGFQAVVLDGLLVTPGERRRADATMQIAVASETITVTAAAALVETSASSVAGRSAQPPARSAAFTPRLREYFPETLVWQPELELDAQGQATLTFPLADNLTTWRLRALASTSTGQVATAEGDVVAFQPLFAELEPPPVLTVGDRIELPVPVRNLLESPQHLRLGLERGAALAGEPDERELDVAAGGVASGTFALEARTAARATALTVFATGDSHGDRVRKSIEVRPAGEPVVESQARAAAGGARIEWRVPEAALPGSAWAELRVLPDLRSQVVQAVEGALQRPWGCGEQTVSAAFPSLLLLELDGPEGPQAARARSYVEQALERLKAYEASEGGFSYWGEGPADPALTAHALRFLARAARFAEVAPARLARTRAALLRVQAPDGAWTSGAGRADLPLTAQVARALAEVGPDAEAVEALRRAYAVLSPEAERGTEPYLLATLALLAERLSEAATARAALARLGALERREGPGAFWDLQTNTPFYGWGAAGRLETTGLVLQALERAGSPDARAAADRALAFLLKHQDAYGAWWSSQATVNVLEGIVARVAREPVATPPAADVAVWLDGERLQAVAWPAPGVAAAPLVIGLSEFLAPGPHVAELRGAPAGSSFLQLVNGHSRAWPSRAESAPGLRFAVAYDRLALRRGEWVGVQVQAERVGFRGYGMLLAEVGLPPGADVDRVSLERALGSVAGLERYELQPDRVVLYLWPRAGGVTARFRFRPRFAMQAASAPSQLYDYYNPEERTQQAPAQFSVR